MPTPPSTHDAALFDSSHYAADLGQRLRRGFELGPKYYLFDVPRYVQQRRKLKLPLLDWQVLWNPVRSFRGTTYVQLPLPPRYDEALELLRRAGVQFTNPRMRTEALVGMWWSARDATGDVIECGAYRGATSLLLAVLGKLHGLAQRVLMLDTFAGMPEISEFDSSRKSGEFAPPTGWPAIIAEQIGALGVADRTEVHQGLFGETFARLAARDPKFAFGHIDANIFEGTRDACSYVLPRLATGGVVVFDDYNGLMDLGARLAIDDYLREAQGGARPLPLAESSAYLRK
ncbi:MAG TPA: TylF/MycF/NovP-related O-methyltransferase [Kofleriaceae bacterium]|jgi:hypothetical protein|nr:TylF/MycF/NovP-related O-methyltransferase [Kofleriaceae bacterium]